MLKIPSCYKKKTGKALNIETVGRRGMETLGYTGAGCQRKEEACVCRLCLLVHKDEGTSLSIFRLYDMIPIPPAPPISFISWHFPPFSVVGCNVAGLEERLLTCLIANQRLPRFVARPPRSISSPSTVLWRGKVSPKEGTAATAFRQQCDCTCRAPSPRWT